MRLQAPIRFLVRKPFFVFGILLFSCLLIACGGQEGGESGQDNTAGKQGTSDEVKRSDQDQPVKPDTNEAKAEQAMPAELGVKDHYGNVMGRITPGQYSLTITETGLTLAGKKDGNKMKFFDSEESELIQLKYPSKNSFKVRTPQGELHWKVKLYEDKIKISDNEENASAYQLKRSGSGKIKIKRFEKELASAKVNEAKGVIEIESNQGNRFEVPTIQGLWAWAVMGLEEIPVEERFMIVLELLERKK